jgi:hypothetical protein
LVTASGIGRSGAAWFKVRCRRVVEVLVLAQDGHQVALNDQAQRTVLCKDPFRSVDERVEKLIAGM